MLLESNRLLFDLQQANEIALSCCGILEPERIALTITEGLAHRFGCVLARLWLLEPGETTLRLVASSGLYTHINGAFARVPLGAYKVGKIAQNRVAFLSNNLPEEPWVGNREWAIEQKIRGFAGYPLAVGDRAIGVLAAFSREAMQPEFLEILQTICTAATIALDSAFRERQQQRLSQEDSAKRSQLPATSQELPLSDRLAGILPSARLTLVGTETTLPVSTVYALLKVGEVLEQVKCSYGRLIYTEESVTLEAIAPVEAIPSRDPVRWLSGAIGRFDNLQFSVSQSVVQVALTIPHHRPPTPLSERESEIVKLLAQGDRDRDIATRLAISESTVKFHIDRAVRKLKAKTRYQAIYQAIAGGWI